MEYTIKGTFLFLVKAFFNWNAQLRKLFLVKAFFKPEYAIRGTFLFLVNAFFNWNAQLGIIYGKGFFLIGIHN